MTYLIIQHDKDGRVFFYEESEEHHPTGEKWRKEGDELTRLEFEELPNDCEVQPGSYFVVPIFEVDA